MIDNIYIYIYIDSECGKIRKFESNHFCFVKANMGPQEATPYIMSYMLYETLQEGYLVDYIY